jgi:NTP pyrophosphatase (non-canonical NTP hydrolase)
MNTTEFQQRLKKFYTEKGSLDTDSFFCLGLLAEDTGEVARIIRQLEFGPHPLNTQIAPDQFNKKQLVEKLGNILGTITLLSNKYDIKLQDICEEHIEKLERLHTMMNN